MFWLSIVNGILLGVLASMLWRLRRSSQTLVATNAEQRMMLTMTGHIVNMVLDRSAGMVSCDACGDSLRPGEPIGVLVSPDGEQLMHDKCVPEEVRNT